MLDFRQLTYFVAVAETLHFGRAAERLHVAQPALSMQIKALEAKLGVRLLARTKRSVSLTEAGALFLAEARLTLEQARNAEDVGRRAARAALGRVEVGYDSSVPFTGVLPAVLRNFGPEHPEVELVLSEHPPAAHAEALESGALDFSVYRTGYADMGPGLQSMPLLHESFDVVLPSAHPLALEDAVAIGDLAAEPLIVCRGHCAADDPSQIVALCRRHGFAMHVERSVSQLTAIVSLAAAGLGLGVVPHSLSQLNISGAVFRPLAVEAVSTVAFACRRNEQAPATLALVKAARRFAMKAQTMSSGERRGDYSSERAAGPRVRPLFDEAHRSVETAKTGGRFSNDRAGFRSL